jgi:hypothetical protein
MLMASDRGLEVQFELGKKLDGPFGEHVVEALVDQGARWILARAR